MFISHKSNVILSINESEWQCRRYAKGLDKSDYWAWVETIKDSDGNPDYSGETGYTIVECNDENVQQRLVQLDNYISFKHEGTKYNIKYYATKRDSEIDGVKSHFIGDDTAKDKRILDEEWVRIRTERTRLLGDTDHHALSDQTLSDNMKTYRKA